MALSVNNSTFSQTLRALLLIGFFSFSGFSQDSQPTLESILAINEPAARLEALQKFLQSQPDAPQSDAARAEITRVYAYLGETQLAEKNVDGGLQKFKQAIASFPKQIDDKFFDEVALRLPVAISARGYRTEAILLARELEARFGADSKRLASIGEFYLSLEAPIEALRALNSALKLTPDSARIHRLLGSAHRVNLNLDKAADAYTAAIKADAKDPRAYFELANLQRARGRYEIAINLYNHQLGLEPEHAPSMKGLALCHIAQGREDRANELLAQAAKITNADLTQDFYLQTQLAMTYLARGNVAKARQASDAALAAEPRFSWARIAAAEVELAEGKYFEAERNVIAAMKYADFPTLHFTLGKIYLAVEDFEGALDELGKAFNYKSGKYHALLGGVQQISADSIAELLAPERQASMFQAEPLTTDVEFKMAENLARFETAIRRAKLSVSQLPSAMILNQKNNQGAATEIERTTEDFVETEGSRKPFRWLYAAERLTQSGQALESVLKLTDQALEAAEPAVAPEGSLRDYPNYDKAGRLQVYRGRALTLRGRALIKLNRTVEAITTLERAVESYGVLPERNRAQWQLALAKETAGQSKEALDLYIAAYEPPEKSAIGSDLNRTVIESLYRKVYGSLNGLNERIGNARETALAANIAPVPTPKPVASAPAETPTEKAATEMNKAAETKAEVAKAEEIKAEVAKEIKPETKPETVAETAPTTEPTLKTEAVPAIAPVQLPEAQQVALAIIELSNLESVPELQFENEDAPPPSMTTVARTFKPAEENSKEVNNAIVSPVVLPDIKPLAPALVIEELARLELPAELSLEVEDAPLPVKATEAPATAATTVAVEETKSSPTPTPVTLPDVVVTSTALLLPLEDETLRNLPELTLAFLEEENPAPPKPVAEVAAKTNATPEPTTTTPETNLLKKETEAIPPPQQSSVVAVDAKEITKEVEAPTVNKAQLSDARVAELEKAISGTGKPVGKKGDSVAVVEESLSGHLEGDAPVRVAKAPEPILPAGESGRVVPTVPKVDTPSDEPKSEGLPAEVESRAKAMGQSAGQLSADAAMEVDVPNRPAGQGRKGTRSADEPKPKVNVRPRRVADKDEDEKPKPRNQ